MKRTYRYFVALAAAALLLCLVPSMLQAFPKPKLVPTEWELKIKYEKPRRIVVMLPGSDVPHAYWYLLFTVTNPTDVEQAFLPNFQLVTKMGTAIQSDQNIPQEVFDAIQARERIKDLEPLAKVAGRLLVGNDQAKDGLAIWPEPADARMETFDIFIGGLSGESCFLKDGQETQIKDWTALSDQEKKDLIVLHKTLQLTFQMPGEGFRDNQDSIIDKGSQWVMR